MWLKLVVHLGERSRQISAQDQTGLYCEFQANQGCVSRLCLKKEKKKKERRSVLERENINSWVLRSLGV